MYFNIDSISENQKLGLKELKTELDIEFSVDGVLLSAKKDDFFSVDYDGINAIITYKYPSEFYRAIAMIINANGKKVLFKCNRRFDNFGIHNNTVGSSRNIASIKKFIKKIALLGYSEFEFYMQNNFEIDGEPYFGYGQARYSQKELKEIADLGQLLGVKIIPCLETLAHQPDLIKWDVYKPLFDIDDVFDVSNSKVYELIEKMISTCSKCFHSDVINLGMDEAHYIGHGNYYRKNGFKPRIEIFLDYLNVIVEISKKYGYKEQVIWTDMLYTTYNDYYYWGKNQLPKNVIDRIPQSVTLCYWDYYGTDNDHYNWCMKNHIETGHKFLFAGGVWTWVGDVVHNRWTIKILNMAFDYCEKNKVKNILLTSWGKAPIYYGLPSLAFVSSYAYGENEDYMKSLFATIMKIEYDDFMLLDSVNYIDEDQCFVYPVAEQTLYNDYFIGLADSCVVEGKSDIWLNTIKKLQVAKDRYMEYSEIYNKMIVISEICYLKYELGIKTRKAYKNKDFNSLKDLVKNNYLPLVGLYQKYYDIENIIWHKENKIEGFEEVDIYIGGMIQRTKYAISQLNLLINGEIDSILELENDQLEMIDKGYNYKNGQYRNNVVGFHKLFSIAFKNIV